MRCKRVLNIAYCQGIIHVGDHVNNLPPKSAWGEIVDMVILGVIFFHDFNPNPNPNKIQWGEIVELVNLGGIINMVPNVLLFATVHVFTFTVLDVS